MTCGLRLRAAVASSGEEGLAKLDAFHPDVVLLDYHLPGMNGLEVLARMRERDRGIKVIMLTGHASVRMAVDAMKAGAYDYLNKPVVLSELKLLLDKALGEGRVEQELSYYRQQHASKGGLEQLGKRQGVDIRAPGNSPPRLVTMQEAHDGSCSAETRAHLQAGGVQAFGDDLGGTMLLQAQFRMAMKIASECH